jgi:hypothetical protein
MYDLTPSEFLEKMNRYVTHYKKVQDAELIYQKMYRDLQNLDRLLNEKTEQSNLTDIDINVEIDELKNEKHYIKSRINNFRPQADGRKRWEETREFINLYNSKVSFYSVVHVQLSNQDIHFMLVSSTIKENLNAEKLWCMKSETPLAKACLGKSRGSEFSYVAPSGVSEHGKILNCSLPTIEQMQQLIYSQTQPSDKGFSQQIKPFELHDLYGTNNSRLRKGG